MPEFTGNVHSLNLTLPFPPPTAGATVFALGRLFGDPAAGADGLDVWVDDAERCLREAAEQVARARRRLVQVGPEDHGLSVGTARYPGQGECSDGRYRCDR